MRKFFWPIDSQFWGLVAAAVIVLAAIVIATQLEDKLEIIGLGLLTGILSGVITFLVGALYHMDINNRLARYERMGVFNLLTNRHDRDYYGSILKRARMEVSVIGTTCSRFIDDFLDLRSESKPLVDALNNNPGLRIRILRAMETNDDRISGLIEDLEEKYGDRFQIRRLPVGAVKNSGAKPSRPRALYSFVLADDEVVVSPVLGDESTKNSPALHVKMSTVYGKRHKECFDDIWQVAGKDVT